MTSRRAAAPLRVTERIDYTLKSVLLLSINEGSYLTTKAVAEHYGMSQKLLGSVLWSLRGAGIVTSRPGWHGGFQLARSPRRSPSGGHRGGKRRPGERESSRRVRCVARGWHRHDPAAIGGPRHQPRCRLLAGTGRPGAEHADRVHLGRPDSSAPTQLNRADSTDP